MLKKNAPLIILVGIVILLAGLIGYKVLDKNTNVQPPQQANNVSSDSENKQVNNENISGEQELEKAQNEKTKSPVPDGDPAKGEMFVQGQVKAVDVQKRILTIDQHMDDNSVDIAPNVAVSQDAVIQNKDNDISLGEIKVGDIVGIILTKDQQARAVLVNF